MKINVLAGSSSRATEEDPRWPRVLARDPSADGSFWYSVVTTGIYCRPSCPSRAARPENVCLHDSPEAARAAGFRPCRRCNPDGQSLDAAHAARIARACQLIDASHESLSLAKLASAAGLSTSHFHRLFRRLTGLTPKGYADARRAERARSELATAPTVTDAIYGAGFGSSSRFYEKSSEILGMTAARYRAGGIQEEIRFAVGQCSLGAILAASGKRGVVAILIADDPEVLVRDLQDRFPKARLIGGDSAYEEIIGRVVGLVEAPGLGLALPLDIRGTVFQKRVWQALQAIPSGQTASYSEIARRVGAPAAARAVAGACAANMLAVAIPCHRVVREDGALSGYRWGVERKRLLLEREASAVTA